MMTSQPRQVCKPSPNFPAPASLTVNFTALKLDLDRWDPVTKTYTKVGEVVGQALKRSEFGAMTHGPKIRMSDVRKGRAAGKPVLPVYFDAPTRGARGVA